MQILRDSLDVFTNKSKAEIELEVMRKEIEVLEGKLQMAAKDHEAKLLEKEVEIQKLTTERQNLMKDKVYPLLNELKTREVIIR